MEEIKNLELNPGNSDNIDVVISFFEKLGFLLDKSHSNKKYFYMNKILSDTDQIDAQGDENHISIRLIGRKYVEEQNDYNNFDKNSISQKISKWESYYENKTE